MKKIRCAIYTRKSSEEGLDQEFNSLHAQREACASYIASQKHEGWVMLPDHYDDGGISGGTLERDALQRLLCDVDEGLVDQIVVYKIDRLTRSLADFAKLVERLDTAEASFVSVTQSFNTATSMGRLTLNVLLSFAQFEREVTAERIRDKIAASKKKGLWMGGNVPLGYQPDGRTLKIDEEAATTVRSLYDLYLAHRSVIAVTREAEGTGLRGRPVEGQDPRPFGRGHIYYILTNPVYAGRIRHRDQVHDGQHAAIIEPNTWDDVQAMLAQSAGRKRGKGQAADNASLLAGRLFDETGDRLTPSHASKKGWRYRYYVSHRLIVERRGDCDSAPSEGWRLPAKPLERQLGVAVAARLRDRLATDLLQEPSVNSIERINRRLDQLASSASRTGHSVTLGMIERVTIAPRQLQVMLDANAVAGQFEQDASSINPDALRFVLPFQYRKRGVETRLIIGDDQAGTVDRALIRNIARAHQYYEAIRRGSTFEEIAAAENLTRSRVLQMINMAFLAPDIVRSIVQGEQPVTLTARWLHLHPMPSDWQAQRDIVARL